MIPIPKSIYLTKHQDSLRNKVVLDLACHDGESTHVIQQLGALHIFGVDVRSHLIEAAREKITGNVDFFVGDITDPAMISQLVDKSDTVVILGVLYHLFDHFRFLSTILKPNIQHCIIETVCGPESLNPEMFWGFEKTDRDTNGWYASIDTIPNGTPNLSWIIQSSKIFGFDCDWVEYHGHKDPKRVSQITNEEYLAVAGPSWPSYQDLVLEKNIPDFVYDEINQMLNSYEHCYRRMIIRLYNTNLIQSTPVQLQEVYRWPY